ncbi:nuclear transport factor 2 family protein [Flavihumibacter rivuli]|uniref:nuclear transport factor 2 family protein n=1 Tax=Flavihumibacter rivuli TaxID=2838156 RepID=UPI001BDE21E4|nr:nuclear transport factor 2 family protein [Flavihumibacter rivuli]ULQ56923.1 nuclear transport factor 2 family protein [Flavihumibacter rivuli]
MINKEQIIKLEDELVKAIQSSDIVTLNKLLHPDLLFILPGGQTITKEMDLASHRSGTMIVEELNPTIEQINLIDSTAVVIVVYDTKGKMQGTPIQGKFRYIRIWSSINGDLKVIGGSCIQL